MLTLDHPERIELRHAIRQYEAEIAVENMPDHGRLLEIGTGDGWQAAFFSQKGFQVNAIDIAESIHLGKAVFSVQIYDGHKIPFPSNTFDIVFSSNVLEHIPWCETILREMGRVLKDNGIMVHIVPTFAWRVWTSAAHYLRNLQILWQLLKRPAACQNRPNTQSVQRPIQTPSRRLRLALIPCRHGVCGNWVTEIYYFSQERWKKMFQRGDLEIVKTFKTGIFYTGYCIPGINTPISTRIKLGKIMGSSTMVFILRKLKQSS
jgi:SAM-dependent methyltransferase